MRVYITVAHLTYRQGLLSLGMGNTKAPSGISTSPSLTKAAHSLWRYAQIWRNRRTLPKWEFLRETSYSVEIYGPIFLADCYHCP